MVFARTSKGASRLSEEIRSRRFEKTYYAIVEGIPQSKEGRLQDFLLKDKKKNKVTVVKAESPEAKEALLEYQVLESVQRLMCLKVRLITGRPHQIRVRFSSRGLPIYGDIK